MQVRGGLMNAGYDGGQYGGGYGAQYMAVDPEPRRVIIDLLRVIIDLLRKTR